MRRRFFKSNQPVYMIGVAAGLAGMHPQTLRLYERKKLVCPKRTAGSTRLYSERDIEILKYIQELTQEIGINLAGVKVILELEKEREDLEEKFGEIEQKMLKMREEMREEIEKIHRSYRKEIVLFPRGQIVRK
jgi:MerR family transcriptional regulator/heat shock protein HspR